MKKILILILIITSCRVQPVVVSKKVTLRDTTRDYNPEIDMSGWTLFEKALFNTWDEMSDSDKEFFKSCLIGPDTLKLR
jgi:hypothetical protein